jgi:beta-phosphoglucomutase-like phosphatase (HAD superfamily)
MLKPVVLFDIDGTLIDSNDAHVEAWQRAFAAEGYAISRTEIHAQVGKGGDNLVPSLLPDVPAKTQGRIDQAHGEIYKRDFLPRVEPFAGAAESGRYVERQLLDNPYHARHAAFLSLLGVEGDLDGGRKQACGDRYRRVTRNWSRDRGAPCEGRPFGRGELRREYRGSRSSRYKH